MFLTSLLLAIIPTLSAPAPQNQRQAVTAKYHELTAAKDAEGLAKLWQGNVGLILQTIDADLERSLSLWENEPENPPAEEIKALHTRALFGARVASQTLHQPIFLDYASSFVGWDNPQKQAFRAGQQVYGRAMGEMKKEEYQLAFEAAKETVERAAALGDWWGTAMGYSTQGAAARHMGFFEDALLAYGMARQINHALGLRSSELDNLAGMLATCVALERPQRALAAASDLADLAQALGNQEILKSSLESKAQLEAKLGLDAEAAQTAKRLETLGK